MVKNLRLILLLVTMVLLGSQGCESSSPARSTSDAATGTGGAGGSSMGGSFSQPDGSLPPSGGLNIDGAPVGGAGGTGSPDDIQCKANYECYRDIPYCHPTQQICMECLTQAHCKDPVYKVCNTVLGECAECATKADCPAGQACDRGFCENECTKDSQCSYFCEPTQKVCVECLNDSHCKDAFSFSPKKCNLTTHQCEETRCKVNANCPIGQVCAADGFCVESCLSNEDCSRSTEGNYCDVTSKLCVECLNDTQCREFSQIYITCSAKTHQCEETLCNTNANCPTGQVCGSDGYCEPACTADKDCADTFYHPYCNTNTQICVECLNNAQCKEEYSSATVCNQSTHECEETKCKTSSDCATGQACNREGTCEETCLNDADCVFGGLIRHCDPKTLLCVECLTNEQCKTTTQGQTLYCAENVCGECLTDAHCSTLGFADYPYCNRGECTECRTDADCKRLGGSICNKEGYCSIWLATPLVSSTLVSGPTLSSSPVKAARPRLLPAGTHRAFNKGNKP